MLLEKIICPICHAPMRKSPKKQLFETVIRDRKMNGPTEKTQASFFFCRNCHNVQTFLELDEPAKTES